MGDSSKVSLLLAHRAVSRHAAPRSCVWHAARLLEAMQACGSVGSCSLASLECACYEGYAGAACGFCADGYQRFGQACLVVAALTDTAPTDEAADPTATPVLTPPPPTDSTTEPPPSAVPPPPPPPPAPLPVRTATTRRTLMHNVTRKLPCHLVSLLRWLTRQAASVPTPFCWNPGREHGCCNAGGGLVEGGVPCSAGHHHCSEHHHWHCAASNAVPRVVFVTHTRCAAIATPRNGPRGLVRLRFVDTVRHTSWPHGGITTAVFDTSARRAMEAAELGVRRGRRQPGRGVGPSSHASRTVRTRLAQCQPGWLPRG